MVSTGLAILSAVAAVLVTGVSTLPTKYDQRQEGDLNVRTDVEDVVFVVVPPKDLIAAGMGIVAATAGSLLSKNHYQGLGHTAWPLRNPGSKIGYLTPDKSPFKIDLGTPAFHSHKKIIHYGDPNRYNFHDIKTPIRITLNTGEIETPAVVERLGTEKVTPEKQNQEKTSQEKIADVQEDKLDNTEKMSPEKVSQEKVSMEKESQEKITPIEKPNQEKIFFEKVTPEKSSVDKQDQDKVSQEKMSQEEMPLKKINQDKMSPEKPNQEVISQKLNQDKPFEKKTQEKTTPEKVNRETMSQQKENLTSGKPTKEQISQPSQEKVTTMQLSEGKPASEKTSQDKTTQVKLAQEKPSQGKLGQAPHVPAEKLTADKQKPAKEELEETSPTTENSKTVKKDLKSDAEKPKETFGLTKLTEKLVSAVDAPKVAGEFSTGGLGPTSIFSHEGCGPDAVRDVRGICVYKKELV